MGAAILACAGRFHLATAAVGNVLGAVAYAQHGHLAHKLAQVDLEGFGVVHRVGRTRENDSNYALVAHRELVVGQNFAERVELTHAAAYELGRLRAEVENDNLLLHCVYFSFIWCVCNL